MLPMTIVVGGTSQGGVMEDVLANTRRKARFIAELRFPRMPRFFDMRGSLIAELHPRVREHFPHWQSDPNSVLFGDRLEQPIDQFHVGLDRVAFRLEDPGTLQQFVDLAVKHLGFALDRLQPHITELARVGVRALSVHTKGDQLDFAHYAETVRDRFHKLPPDLSLEYADSFARLVHRHGFYVVGPVRQGEAWVTSAFRNPQEKVPAAGVGLDVDSFATALPYKGRDQAIRAFRDVLNLTLRAEEGIARHAGLLDE